MAVDEVQAALSGLAERFAASVVGVRAPGAAGTGFVLERGRVLTNAHNLRTRSAEVVFGGGRVEAAEAEGVDPDGDIAVLRADTGDLSPVELSGDGRGVLGARVFALSNPGGRGLRVTTGRISAIEQAFRGPRGRRIRGAIEHTAPLPPGSSGGPILDASGHLLGINTNRLSEGFYLALPADDSLAERIRALAAGQAPKRVRLGVAVVPARVARRLRRMVGLEEADGALVRALEEDGPAARAGVQPGDLIVEAAGRAVRDVDDLHDALEGTGEQAAVELKILRGAEAKTVTVEVGT